jgi:hypothetical protein
MVETRIVSNICMTVGEEDELIRYCYRRTIKEVMMCIKWGDKFMQYCYKKKKKTEDFHDVGKQEETNV